MQYITVAGDMLDEICYRHYGAENAVTEFVLQHNHHLADQPPLLPAGVVIVLPDVDTPERVSNSVNLWN